MAIKYITAKLRHDKFKNLLEDIESVAGIKSRSANNLVGGCVFFVHAFITHKMIEGKTPFECFLEKVDKNKHEAALMFINAYYQYLQAKDMKAYKAIHELATSRKK